MIDLPKKPLPSVSEARLFASQFHEASYVQEHLDEVNAIARRYTPPDLDSLIALRIYILTYLHDLVEDVKGKDVFLALYNMFGPEIAFDVWSLTDAEGPNRKTKKLLTFNKIRKHYLYVFAKLCDRYQNASRCHANLLSNNFDEHKRGLSLGSMYVKEHPTFVAALWDPDQPAFVQRLWADLNYFIEVIATRIANEENPRTDETKSVEPA